ncbi:hypothetical protein BKA66DRAFT_572770 [Pyrenochaeta sp. MPI-SDFR-AT-0127]|nr:hypothetical protein BKA66DRAFT_572770 [Pyrenochaeta sp. MPI-SDFR-AT-0127]
MVPESYDRVPSGSCEGETPFWSCQFSPTFWGCCKNDPCLGNGCGLEDILPTYMDRPEQFEYFQNITLPAPPTLSSGVRADGPPPAFVPFVESPHSSRLEVRILTGICIALLIALPVAVGVWIWYRSAFGQINKLQVNTERASLPTRKAESKLESPQFALVEVPSTKNHQDMARMGKKTLYILSVTSVVILGVCGFLAFLWLGDSSTVTWNNIMIRSWATRAVSISALLLRTAVDLQAAIATAIIVSLILESRSGIQLGHLADLSPMRTCSTGPWTFTTTIAEGIWYSAKRHRQNYNWMPLGGDDVTSSIRSSLSYRNISQRITRDSAWTSNPPFFPAYGEYAEPAAASEGVSDTGVLLRSLLPYVTAESRQSLRSYTGKALVLDARVQCQAPRLTRLNNVGHYKDLTGTLNVTNNNSMLQAIKATNFTCTLAGPDQYSICQVGRPIPYFLGSLKSQFVNSTSYGTAFLVTKGFKNTSSQNHTRVESVRGGEWIDIPFANRTELGASFSLCFAPWDASVLDVHLSSSSNRTEPQLQWWGTFRTSEVVDHFLPQSQKPRQILQMQKPHSLIGEFPPAGERPLVQSDASGSSAAEYGSNMPLQENWSIFLTGKPLITMLNDFSRAPSRAIAADPALAAIFTDTMTTTNSVAWALSSIITVLSMGNYYSQQPAFDRVDTVTVSFFTNVLYPRDSLGFVVLMCALGAHFVILFTMVILFINKTQYTLLGNAWSAFWQMAESHDIREHLSDMILEGDGDFCRKLEQATSNNLRARIIRRGSKAKVIVQQLSESKE